MDVMVEMLSVTKEYGRGNTVVHALQDIDLALMAGSFTAIMGPSGSGKSTLLHLMGCLDQPTTGVIKLVGEEVTKITSADLWQIRNRKIGFVFQQHHLLPNLTALENVMLPLKYARFPKVLARHRGKQLLEQLGLANRLQHFPGELSGGEQARVSMARALVNEPQIILADEPTGELDSRTGQQVMDLLRSFCDGERTFLIVTHDSGVASYCDQIIEMQDGRITARH